MNQATDEKTADERIYKTLLDVIHDPVFPEIDLALRGGRQIGPENLEEHAFIERAGTFLEGFYARYGCRVACTSESVYYLVDDQGILPSRIMTVPEMLVGEVLALLLMSSEGLSEGGQIAVSRVLEVLEELVTPHERLVQVMVKGRRAGKNPAIDAQRVRESVGVALHRLSQLGFVECIDGFLFPRRAILRFTDPVRLDDDPRVGLQRLVAAGGVALPVVEAEPAADNGNNEEMDGDDDV